MATTPAFFDERLVHPKYSKKSEKYFSPESTKPLVKKIETGDKTTQLIRWLKLAPAFIFIGLTAALLPSFGLAYAITTRVLFMNIITAMILSRFIKAESTKEYLDLLRNEQLKVTLTGPILEELIFRGFMLHILLLLIGLIFPPAMILPFLNVGISIAAATAITITAILFGLAHQGNAKNNHVQVIVTFCSGLALGFFAVQFGLAVAIGAHIFNNTLACLLINLFGEGDELAQEQQTPEPRMT